MKKLQYLIFFSIVFSIYFAINYYIFIRASEAILPDSLIKQIFNCLFLFLAISFLIGRILERIWMSPVSYVLIWTGSFWLAAMFYFFLIVLIIDFCRLLHRLFQIYPDFITMNHEKISTAILIISILLVLFLLIVGHINAINPKVKKLSIDIRKSVAGLESLKVVAVSDIHLGTIIGSKRAKRLVESINRLNPDVVLLGGDVLDEDVGQVIKKNLGDCIKRINSRFGIFAVTGNHEYIGGVDNVVKYLEEHGVKCLRDNSILVDNKFYLVGRDDRDKSRYTAKKRKLLAALIDPLDKNNPIILLDHQPFNLNEAEIAGVDLQFSGHTHHGQLWPLNFITNKVYEVSWGYKKKGNTHFYVSTGFGTWGPPVRIGNRPEIVQIKLNFILS